MDEEPEGEVERVQHNSFIARMLLSGVGLVALVVLSHLAG